MNKKDLKIDASYDILNDYLNGAVRPTTTGEIVTTLPSRDLYGRNRVMAGLVSPSHNTRKSKKDNDNSALEAGGGGGGGNYITITISVFKSYQY